MDKIKIKKLQIPCILGIYEKEEVVEQVVELDIEIETDLKKSAMLNDLSYSVDYAALVEEISFIVRNSRFRLLEVLVDCVAHYILNSSPNGRERTTINLVRICATKPEAMGDIASPSIEITRRKCDLWFELSNDRGLELVYDSDDCSVYNLSGERDFSSLALGPVSVSLLSLGTDNLLNGNALSVSSESNIQTKDVFKSSEFGSSLIVVRNINRNKVGASLETGFAKECEL